MRKTGGTVTVTIYRAYTTGLINVINREMSSVPGVPRVSWPEGCVVWDYLDATVEQLRQQPYCLTTLEIHRTDRVLAEIHPMLTRGLVLTQELKEHLGYEPDRNFDPRERPVTWRTLTLVIPTLAKGVRGSRQKQPMSRGEMRAVLDRYRGTLHMQIDDACSALYELVDRAPRRAERIVRELLRLGY